MLAGACLVLLLIATADGREANSDVILSPTAAGRVLLVDNESGWWFSIFGSKKTGFVELRLDSKQLSQSTLFLDKNEINTSERAVILLQEPTGQMSIGNAASGWMSWNRVEYCAVTVRENRITSVLVTGPKPIRCQCLNPSSPPDKPQVCQ
jgi:hypothetical protein